MVMGRPRLNIETALVRVSVETHDALAILARRNGCSIREYVGKIVEEIENDL